MADPKRRRRRFFSFLIDEEVVRLDGDWSSGDHPSLASLAITEAAGLCEFRGVRFDYGVAHPDVVAAGETLTLNRNVGQSMRDAFSPFEAAYRYILKREIRPQEVIDPYYPENCSVVTFGSPSSNDLARASLGYREVSGKRYALARKPDALMLPVTYVLDEDDAVVPRNGGSYMEPRWALQTPAERLDTQVSAAGLLTDYLVISCVPNPYSALTTQTLKAKKRLAAEYASRDYFTRLQDDQTLRREIELLKTQADRSLGELHKIIVIGGLHGPGTAATKRMLGDKRLTRTFQERIRGQNLDGKFWQAVIRVDVGVDPASSRDVPTAVSDNIEVFPIALA